MIIKTSEIRNIIIRTFSETSKIIIITSTHILEFFPPLFHFVPKQGGEKLKGGKKLKILHKKSWENFPPAAGFILSQNKGGKKLNGGKKLKDMG